MLKILTALLLIAAVCGSSKISSDLNSSLHTGEQLNIIVSMHGGTTSTLRRIEYQRISNRELRLNALHEALVANSEQSQRSLLKLLSSRNVEFKSIWISNKVYVKNADREIVHLIATDPEVKCIDMEQIVPLHEPVESKQTSAPLQDENQWGIVRIQAPEAWREPGTPNGSGVVVANIDTGVSPKHEALRDNFFGEYGWFDPLTETDFPFDGAGHGSHTMGIAVGSHGIGVAPGAKWAACKACGTMCMQSNLLLCGQFFACPTLTNGSNPDCSKAPNIVSNSWGGMGGNPWFYEVLDAWHLVGIIPVFSAGNVGPECFTVGSPADQLATIGVGSTRDDDAISRFSAVGPSIEENRMKPDIVAPGQDIVSASHLGNETYRLMSGTSMAAPHAAGTIALLLTRNKALSFDDVKNLLLGNADQNLTFNGTVCEGLQDNVFPNYVFGHGRINALKSVRAQSLAMGHHDISISVLGNPLTRRQFAEIRKRLEQAAEEQLNSEDLIKQADILIQEKYEEKNLTYYRGDDKSLPVFISWGLNNVAKKVHVLLRGEDYLNPQDEHTFIVLKQSSDPNQYTVHSAYIDNVNKIATSAIQWFGNLVEQKKNVKPLLEQMGNNEVQARSIRSSRPLCDWIGFLLLCDGPKNVKPIRKERVYPLPADIEDTDPLVPWMVGGSEEEGAAQNDAGAPKAKRQLPPNSGPVVPVATPVFSAPKPSGSSSGSKAASKILSSSGKSKVKVKAEASKAEVLDNSLDREVKEEKVVVAKPVKQEEEISPPAAKVKEPEGRSFGAYEPKKQTEDSSSSKKKHKRKHRKHMRD
ncbi:Bacillopeptidase F [Orchesella cincta]|uniref:Bacillopeptidase F n=1 Tax=Orchesella cincta TaxID=48709 RepID=A0A1D2N046_ORCCI|nr:Bacillopeptidase F [Orchesella cincta]